MAKATLPSVPGVELTDDQNPAGDAGSDGSQGAASEGAAPAPAALSSLTPGDKPPRQRGRARKYTNDRQAKDARNKRLKDKRDAERALREAERAAGITSPPASSSPVGGGDQSGAAPQPDAKQESRQNVEQLAVMIGLGADAFCGMIPAKWGGGDLTAKERELLGGVWAEALAPYLSGPSSVIGVAAITTVQVLWMRALQHREAHRNDATAAAEPKPSAPGEPVATRSTPAPAAQPLNAARHVIAEARTKPVALFSE